MHQGDVLNIKLNMFVLLWLADQSKSQSQRMKKLFKLEQGSISIIYMLD
jgi:hypothetical protein